MRLRSYTPSGHRSSGRVRLPPAPHFSAFIQMQRSVMSDAIERGRYIRRVHTDLRFGMNRVYNTRIEAKMAWWAGVMDREVTRYSRTTREAGDIHFEPDWRVVSSDLRELHTSLGASLYAAMDRHLGQQAIDAATNWPYDTYLSRAMLYLTVEPGRGHGELMSAALVAGAGYSGYIQRSGYRIQTRSWVDKGGRQRTARKRVYDGTRMPAWKSRYLTRDSGGGWRFDTERYEADEASGRKNDHKPAEGKPYRDLITRPARSTVKRIGRDAVAGAVRGS